MKRLILLFLLTACTAYAQEPERLSLDDAIRMGRGQSRSLKVSAARTEAASARADEARANLWPVVRFQGGYRRLSDVGPFAIAVPIFPRPIEVSPSIVNNTTLGLTVQQPLFTGFRLRNASRAASLQAEASMADQQSDEADLVLNVTSAYWGYYQALQNKRYLEENVTRLEADERDTERMMNAGLMTRSDLLRVQVQLSNARLALIDASNESRVAMLNLNNVLGRPLETEVVLVSEPSAADSNAVVPEAAADETALVEKAMTGRPDLEALALRSSATEAAASAARGAWWPQIFLTGNYAYNRPNLRYQPARDEFKGSWDIGVQVQFDIWNWGSTGAQVAQAEATQRQTSLQLEQAKENVALDVKRNALNVRRSREKIGVARLGVSQAEDNVRTTNDRYRSGMATSTDLLNAEVALLQARTSLTGALVEHELALARLRRAIGQQ